MKKIIIVGAGLTGTLFAIHLAKRGFRVELLERRPDMRDSDISAGRSINLAISLRGIHALEEVGLAETIMTQAIPMLGRMIHDTTGKQSYQAYGRHDNEHINSISRGGLNCALLDAADAEPGITLHFNQDIQEVDIAGARLNVVNSESGEQRLVQGDVLIGADGVASVVRGALVAQHGADFSTDLLEHGYKELTIPPALGPRLKTHYLHIWPRDDFMLIALPNADKSFTCTLFFPHKGTPSFETLDTEAAVEAFFQEIFPDVTLLMPTLAHDFFHNPTSVLGTVRGGPWHYQDKALLIGDAAHGIVPFLGQGMNCAFEDCTVFSACLDAYGDDWQALFKAFYQARRPNTNAIADMALANYHEMRNAVGKDTFLLRKQVEQALMTRYPDKYLSRYVMVTFTREDYAKAKAVGEAQEAMLAQLTEGITSIDDVDWALAERLLSECVLV